MRVNSYSTMSEATRALKERGFDHEFKFNGDTLESLSSERVYSSDELVIVEFHRFEGQTNPSDLSVVFAVEGTDGIKGTVVSPYGVYADMKLVEFMDNVKIKKTASN